MNGSTAFSAHQSADNQRNSAIPRDASLPALTSLRRRAQRLYALRDLPLAMPSAPRPYHIALPADPDAPLDQFAVRQPYAPLLPATPPRNEAPHENAADAALQAIASGIHMPYWGLLWPSGQALAENILTQRAASWPTLPAAYDRNRNPRALELGCGLGVTATAALDAGLDLIAADCFTESLLFTRYNTLRNSGRATATLLLDWRTEAGRAACLNRSPFDLLLAADVLYEEDDIAPLLDLAPRLLAPTGQFWLAEPGRRVSRAFVAAALARGWRDTETIYDRTWPPDGDHVRVTVHHLTVTTL